MAENTFKGAPFGTRTARFDVSAVHPVYCKRTTNDSESSLGPGTYNNDRGDFSARTVAERSKGPGWHRALVTAKEAQTPHLLYREAWTNKQFLKTKVGPGTYESTDFIQELAKRPGSVRGVCHGLEKRFRVVQSFTPGPGSYGKGGVPWAALEEKRAQSAGCLKMDRCARVKCFPEETKDCGPSPCMYVPQSSIDILLRKSTSKRGPYDLFTGSRDKPVMSGYFATPKRVGHSHGGYKVDTFVDELSRGEKKKHGVFGTLEQYPSRPTERIYHSTLAQCPRPSVSCHQSLSGKARDFLQAW
ncbi:ciliary microtubule-associated protein 2-like [Polymixia lowei]